MEKQALEFQNTGTRIIKKGHIGDDVALIQRALTALDFSVGASGADGEFGKDTDAGVKAYQASRALERDGEVGPLTRAALEADLRAAAEAGNSGAKEKQEAPKPTATNSAKEKQTALKPIICADFSQHNNLKDKKNDWALIARSVEFLILRCGVTRTSTAPVGIGIDADFEYAAKMCQQHGIPFGVYFYGKVSAEALGREEADMCWKVAVPFNPLFYVYDVEEDCLTDAVINAWVAQMRMYGAKKLGVYIGGSFYAKHKATLPAFDFVWYPRYGKNTGAYDPQYAPPHPCDLHQFTDIGKVPGLADTTADINRLTGAKPLEYFLTPPDAPA
jgi:GH25 family lysozyme M1 (1,4-beta-N-acetylmuramidase)